MAIEVLTKDDLNEFRQDLLKDIKEILHSKPSQTKQWLKSTEVRKLLNISPRHTPNASHQQDTLLHKICGIIYYAHQDIEKLLEGNKVVSVRTLFNSK